MCGTCGCGEAGGGVEDRRAGRGRRTGPRALGRPRPRRTVTRMAAGHAHGHRVRAGPYGHGGVHRRRPSVDGHAAVKGASSGAGASSGVAVRAAGRPGPPRSGPSGSAASADGETITLEQRVLAKNEELAARNRAWLADQGIVAVNLMSSPGAGKTTLLERTVRDLAGRREVAVVEGDQETMLDADRIKRAGCAVVQVNTGAGCHLDAETMRGALDRPVPGPGLAGPGRERRQPGLPRPVRPGRAQPGRGHLGHRGQRQAAEVPVHVRRRGPGRRQQDRPAARTSTSTWPCARRTPARSTRTYACSPCPRPRARACADWYAWVADQS